MKVNVCCVYWILLFVSVVSSCLLFMLVASERVADSSDKTLNISSIEDDLLVKIPEVLKDPEILINEQTIDINNGNSDETIEQKEQEHENLAEIHSSFEEVIPSNNGDNLESNEAATYIVPPEPLSDVSTGYQSKKFR